MDRKGWNIKKWDKAKGLVEAGLGTRRGRRVKIS